MDIEYERQHNQPEDGSGFSGKELARDLESRPESRSSGEGQEFERQYLENMFNRFLDEVRDNPRRFERPREIKYDHADKQASKKIRFGEVELSIAKLMDSPFILDDILQLRGHVKDGRPSVDVVRDLTKAYRDHEYDESKAKDPIRVSLARCEDGKFYYYLNGGRHRIAAAIMAGQEKIIADLSSKAIYLGSPEGLALIEELKASQVHTPRADQIRQNLAKYHKNDNAQVIL